MGCNYYDCFTCPYSDCIATEFEALERDKIEGWHDSGVIGTYEENREKWLAYLEKERERARKRWAQFKKNCPTVKTKRSHTERKAYFAAYRASHREKYRAYQKDYRERKKAATG